MRAALSAVQLALLDTEERCAAFRQQFAQYSHLWERDMQQALRSFLASGTASCGRAGSAGGGEQGPALEAFASELARFRVFQEEVQSLPASVAMGWVRVDARPIKQVRVPASFGMALHLAHAPGLCHMLHGATQSEQQLAVSRLYFRRCSPGFPSGSTCFCATFRARQVGGRELPGPQFKTAECQFLSKWEARTGQTPPHRTACPLPPLLAGGVLSARAVLFHGCSQLNPGCQPGGGRRQPVSIGLPARRQPATLTEGHTSQPAI